MLYRRKTTLTNMYPRAVFYRPGTFLDDCLDPGRYHTGQVREIQTANGYDDIGRPMNAEPERYDKISLVIILTSFNRMFTMSVQSSLLFLTAVCTDCHYKVYHYHRKPYQMDTVT